MTHRGPFQPLPFCDSIKTLLCREDGSAEVKKNNLEGLHPVFRYISI